jgi:hypothetical protein
MEPDSCHQYPYGTKLRFSHPSQLKVSYCFVEKALSVFFNIPCVNIRVVGIQYQKTGDAFS